MRKLITFIFCFICQINIHWAFQKSPGLYQLTSPIDHGEGPVWDGRKDILYYVDIHSGNLHSYEYCSGKTNFINLEGDVTLVAPTVNPDVLIVAVNRSVLAIEWDGKKNLGKQRILTTVSEQFPKSRFNDGKSDKHGRLWFGTMGFEDSSGVEPDQGILYKITEDNLNSPESVIAPVNISNGLCWNKKNNKFYYIDTPTKKVVEYDYDEHDGSIYNKKVVFNMDDHLAITGFPDGMTIDEDDNLWVALWGGGAVIKINPKNGELLQVIALPAKHVTSVMWGGPKLDILFVTTSRFALDIKERKELPAAGAVFAITELGTRGLPIFETDIVKSV